MSTIYAMTPADVHEQLEEPLHLFRTYLDRMTYTMQDLMEGYFQDPNINPEAAVELIGAMAKYGASVRASSKKKNAQAVATSGDEKGGEQA